MRENPLNAPYARIVGRFLDQLIHFLATTAFSLLVYLLFERVDYAVFAVLGGIFIDSDHLLDYLIYAKHFNLKEFLLTPYGKSKKAYVIFHSWELVFIVCITAVIFSYAPVIILSIAMMLHLLIDTLQKKSFLLYCLIYRFFNRFDVSVLGLDL